MDPALSSKVLQGHPWNRLERQGTICRNPELFQMVSGFLVSVDCFNHETGKTLKLTVSRLFGPNGWCLEAAVVEQDMWAGPTSDIMRPRSLFVFLPPEDGIYQQICPWVRTNHQNLVGEYPDMSAQTQV